MNKNNRFVGHANSFLNEGDSVTVTKIDGELIIVQNKEKKIYYKDENAKWVFRDGGYVTEEKEDDNKELNKKKNEKTIKKIIENMNVQVEDLEEVEVIYDVPDYLKVEEGNDKLKYVEEGNDELKYDVDVEVFSQEFINIINASELLFKSKTNKIL
jgi:translation elongation factor P/translation initiation factor 5A